MLSVARQLYVVLIIHNKNVFAKRISRDECSVENPDPEGSLTFFFQNPDPELFVLDPDPRKNLKNRKIIWIGSGSSWIRNSLRVVLFSTSEVIQYCTVRYTERNIRKVLYEKSFSYSIY